MAKGEFERVLRGKAHAKGVAAGKRVETINSLTGNQFFENYFSSSERAALHTRCSDLGLKLDLKDADSLNEQDLDSCLGLIEASSKNDYANSEIRWRPAAKRKEMRLPDMKYILVRRSSSVEKSEFAKDVAGFISFMITYEDGHEVAYIYEIHLSPNLKSRGLGKGLMVATESITREVGISKSMLTVFSSNTCAAAWYDSLGYKVDEFSPGPKRLRNGTVKEPSYKILSRILE